MWLPILITILLAYILGSIPSSVWIGKIFFDVDVREHGSGNAGTTNTIRTLGYKAGVPVFIIDALKGWFAVFMSKVIFGYFPEIEMPDYVQVVAAAAVVIGHIFPVFAGFRGGKGVATLLGVGFGLIPIPALIALGIFIIVLLCFGYVSLASITATVTLPIVTYFFVMPDNLILFLLSIAVAIFVPITHKENIKRLLNGTENKFLKKK
ncbi:MAG: glycerol-3-phosphate 1-O-acyltransferase PlsY [Lentimicrobiaceae bacterium]|nr:glycerol-3-phosphate 1-O-acyltransferase PlsY [Lentimicrobiaceae bacterium]MBE6346330.1 glycerol-3-phosphate 1-O-acyltransferase PlsY [Lentimicrobiaceae bacterium]